MNITTQKRDDGSYFVVIGGKVTPIVVARGDPPKYRQRQEWCIGVMTAGAVNWLTYDQTGKASALATIAALLKAAAA